MAQPSQQVFSARYEITRLIARGGMAEVFLARDLLLDRPVALKVLFSELSTDRSFVERFRREAQAAANLSHPHIVSVYDWGEEDGTYFMVMEYVEGRPLSQIIRTEGPLPSDQAASVAAEVAAALAFAHRNGVVHRDVKPGNVLITASGGVKVADFGIARALNTDENLTQTGAVMGTATYFSPEQARGETVDPRSDVYSLGVMLYEMVVGRPPFTGDNPMTVAYKHVSEPPVPPRRLDPDIPADLEAIVLHAMAKDPGDRYASAEELRADLIRFRQHRRVLASSVLAEETMAVAATPAGAPRTTLQPAVERTILGPEVETFEEPERRTGVYVAILLLMLAALGVLLFLLARSLGVFGGSDDTPAVIEVPSIIGLTNDEAVQRLEAAGLKPSAVSEPNEAEEGRVFEQDPEEGAQVDRDSTVTYKVSSGPEENEVPSVLGMDKDDAREILSRAGFDVADRTEPSDTVAADRVISQDPGPGETLPKGERVTIVISAGKEKVAIPDVKGQDQTEAAATLGRQGFQVRTRREASDSVAEGRVIRTDPPAGAEVEKGSTVTLVVSSGPEGVEVPNVIGLRESEAREQLQRAGFSVDVQRVATNDPSQDRRVIDQNPSPGERRPRGSTITIVVAELRATGTSNP